MKFWQIKAIPVLMAICLGFVDTSASYAQQGTTKSRQQAALQLIGDFPPEGGFRITQAPAAGPGTNLELPNATPPTKGSLEAGDVITAIEGQKFRSRREFLDAMNLAYQRNAGRVQITVRDVNSGKSVVWIAHPVLMQMDVPVADSMQDLAAILDRIIEAAPAVPMVPATLSE